MIQRLRLQALCVPPTAPFTTRSKLATCLLSRTGAAADETTQSAGVPPTCVQTNACADPGTAAPVLSPTTPFEKQPASLRRKAWAKFS